MTKSNASLRAKIVRVTVEEDKTGLFFATSPQLKGLLVAKQTLDELHAAIPQAIYELYAVCGEEVLVSPADDGVGGEETWVAFPKEAAKEFLYA